MQKYADDITKMTIVGDKKWKDEAFMVAGKSFRTTEIEFFPTNQLELATARKSDTYFLFSIPKVKTFAFQANRFITDGTIYG